MSVISTASQIFIWWLQIAMHFQRKEKSVEIQNNYKLTESLILMRISFKLGDFHFRYGKNEVLSPQTCE